MTTTRILMVALLIAVAVFGLQIALAQQPAEIAPGQPLLVPAN